MFVFYLRIHLNLGLFKKKTTTTKLGWEVLLFVQSLPGVFF